MKIINSPISKSIVIRLFRWDIVFMIVDRWEILDAKEAGDVDRETYKINVENENYNITVGDK